VTSVRPVRHFFDIVFTYYVLTLRVRHRFFVFSLLEILLSFYIVLVLVVNRTKFDEHYYQD